MENESRLTDVLNMREFILAGNATFTLHLSDGMHYTYRVRSAADSPSLWFVKVLTGPSNDSDYNYIGVIRSNGTFGLTRASKLPLNAPAVKAITKFLAHLRNGSEPPDMEIWHAGRCGRCGRLLTVPASILNGFGPECMAIMAA